MTSTEEIISLYKNDKNQLYNSSTITTILDYIEKVPISTTSDSSKGDAVITLVNILCEVVKDNVDLVIPLLKQYYGCILYLLKETSGTVQTPPAIPSSPNRSSVLSGSPNPSNMIEVANATVYTMFGTISFLFPTNNTLLSQSIPFVLEIGKQNAQIQSIVFSSLSSEAINQASVLAPYVNDLIKYSSKYPNYLSILSGLIQYNPKDFENNLGFLITEFEDKSESKASVLSIFSEVAKHNPYSIIPYIVQLKSCLQQQSLCTLYGIILKSVVSKYPSAITPIFSDILESISNITSSKYSLVQIIGMCGPEKTEQSLEYLFQLLNNQNNLPPDTIVSILKGMKSIQKTSPNLFNNPQLFSKYLQSNNYTEFITTLAQDLIDQIKESSTTTTKKQSYCRPLSDSLLESIDNQRPQVAKELESISQYDAIRDHLLTKYQLIFDVLQLIPIPSGTTGDMLFFKFGNDRIELPVSSHLDFWKSIDFLQSIVRLDRFLEPNQQLSWDNQSDQSIIRSPIPSSDTIKQVYNNLNQIFEQHLNNNSNNSNNNVSSNLANTISNNNNNESIVTSSPNIETTTTTTTTTTSNNNMSSNNQPQNIIFEGYLDKQSKYLKRYDTLWFTLTVDHLSGNQAKKEKDSSPPVSPTSDDETSVRIPLTEILEIKEGERSTGHFTIKRVKDKGAADQLSELKSFYIVTPKRKYLMKAPTQQDQHNWIQKLKHQLQILNNPNDLINNNINNDNNNNTTTNNNNNNKKPNKKLNFKLSQYFGGKQKK
ncbi:hypothetical protein PPL_02696 [Heterostelium album PN500]|uniref:PH domain-containing protein n=1 Tax=Heterostelium pallidum (strain ATCC 26659 / Pp 5 / PN500) TaxID=670386 RepID=D3B2T2_HETP5|nr:hypothetical protein PPL_02696 [Heterostelium album PN500]EFA83630.1 hypothetical protein PPL_02696 [Heterostelium album PN500]|eukprot:XP_020435747.1 hypothetical protein PPL_02696 [Heterostelium album PN500]